MTKPSLKSLIGGAGQGAAPAPKPEPVPEAPKSYRVAQTRQNTRAIAGYFAPEVARELKMLAAEQDKDNQELLAEALNMLFQRYGKPTRAEIVSGRRKRT
jgi:hypothetical protein